MPDVLIPDLMLVDDEVVDLRLCQRIIDRTGIVGRVHAYHRPEEALEHLRVGEAIDAILLDIRMPGMNGFEFLEAAIDEFGPSFAGVVVIMLTTSMDPNDRERAEQLDLVKDYFVKPLNSDYVGRLAELVEAQRTRP